MSDEILRWLTSLGVAGVLVALINALFGKRKLSAEATNIITDAASGTLKDVREDNIALRSRMDAAEKQIQQQADHQRQTDALITVHGEWDRQAFYAARSKGIDLPQPPPLTIGANE